jgi:hypothetical protein
MTQPDFGYIYHWNRMSRKGQAWAVLARGKMKCDPTPQNADRCERTIMKAISLWQPWASLIACGAKPYETRSFAPPALLIGQSIAIHAARKIDKGAAQFAEELMYGQHKDGGFDVADRLEATMSGIPDELMGIFRQATLPIGCVVAIARLDAAFQLGNPAHGTALPAATAVKPAARCRNASRFAMATSATVRLAAGPGCSATPSRSIHRSMKSHQGFVDLPQGWLVPA